MPRDPLLRYSEHIVEFGTREFAKVQRAHEEGVIAKRATGPYYSAKRTREWLKFKVVHQQEVVIVGYTGLASTLGRWFLHYETKPLSAGCMPVMSAPALIRQR